MFRKFLYVIAGFVYLLALPLLIAGAVTIAGNLLYTGVGLVALGFAAIAGAGALFAALLGSREDPGGAVTGMGFWAIWMLVGAIVGSFVLGGMLNSDFEFFVYTAVGVGLGLWFYGVAGLAVLAAISAPSKTI